MDCNSQGASPDRDLPVGCWHNVFRFLDAPALARAAAVNRTCRTAAYDDRLWYPHFKEVLSPENCGSLQTARNGKDYRSLCGRWQTGQFATVDLIPRVHAQGMPSWQCRVSAIEFSQAGAIAVWSVGWDGSLVCTDIATCQMRHKFQPPDHEGPLGGVTVLDSMGLVYAAGTLMTGWDPRQAGIGSSSTPAFSMEYWKATDDVVSTMISAACPERDGPPQLLTGGNSKICLWDLRFMDAGPVRQYAESKAVYCLAREPRHGTLLSGGKAGIACWDWETGVQLAAVRIDDRSIVESLAVGRDRLLACDSYPHTGRVSEWAIPDPRAIVEWREPQRVFTLADKGLLEAPSMKGIGEGPDRILGGTYYGSICMWECPEHSQQLPICWSLGNHTCTETSVTCIAATDQVVVNGFDNGTLRIIPMSGSLEIEILSNLTQLLGAPRLTQIVLPQQIR